MEPAQRGRRGQVVDLFRTTARPLSTREVADATGLHINTTRFHLDTLVRQGVLRRQGGRAAGPGRPPSRYALVPGMQRGGQRNYKLLAEMLLTHLAADGESRTAAVRAGEAWGRYLVQAPAPGQRLSAAESTQRLSELLDDIGFDPRVSDARGRATRVELRHCPFLELAQTQRDLVCGVHLGLMRGALDQLRTSLEVRSLTPFADPHTCVAHVAPVSPTEPKE